MRLIDANKLIMQLNDYALQESPMYFDSPEQLAAYEAIQDCISMVENAETMQLMNVVVHGKHRTGTAKRSAKQKAFANIVKAKEKLCSIQESIPIQAYAKIIYQIERSDFDGAMAEIEDWKEQIARKSYKQCQEALKDNEEAE